MAGGDQPQLSHLQVSDLYEATGYAMTALGLMHDRGRILLTLDARDRRWRLPGGAVNRMETPADAARREIRSIMGICVRTGEFLGMVHDPRECALQLVFQVRPVAGSEARLDTTRVLHAVWFRPGALPVNVCERTRSTIEAFSGAKTLPFLVTHRGGEGGVWQS
jgi:ADP-ribose pyrophosphatase YjhB (NUDIX family)